MDSKIISKDMAIKIANDFKNEILQIDGDGILSVFLIGSLGGEYYRPGQSDIDTVILVKDNAIITQKQLDEIAEKYWHTYEVPKGFGSIMIYEHELFPPYEKNRADDFEFTVEIARLKTQGKAIYGSYDLGNVPMPTRQHFIYDAIIMGKWFDAEFGYPMYRKLRVTGCINCILGTMRRYLMIEKNIFEFNKFQTINAYLNNSPNIVDVKIFEIIKKYLNDELTEPNEFLTELQDFGIKISDYYNEKLLGIKRDLIK
jgi:hypothetical protein